MMILLDFQQQQENLNCHVDEYRSFFSCQLCSQDFSMMQSKLLMRACEKTKPFHNNFRV